MSQTRDILGQITFLYYQDLDQVVPFYRDVLGLELVEDQGWAKIFRVYHSAYLGIVAGKQGFHAPRAENAVLITLVVEDAAQWYARLEQTDVKFLSQLENRKEIGIRCFFVQDPGGYTLEIQQFMNPDQIDIFYHQIKGGQR